VIVAVAVVFVGCCPKANWSTTANVGLAAFPVVPVVSEPPQPLDPAALIVNVAVPGGVELEVLTVRVETWLVPELVKGLLLNEAEAPVGSPDAVRVEVQLPLPVKLTVTEYVAEAPAVTGVGVWAPTLVIFPMLSASVNVVLACEFAPRAVT
jgi:hypothetical protein